MQDAARFSMGLGIMTLNPELIRAAKKKVPANEKIGLALIGARGRGYRVLQQALEQPETHCVAICDIVDQVIADRKAELMKLQDDVPTVYKDCRRLYMDPGRDAVLRGTPEHWQ